MGGTFATGLGRAAMRRLFALVAACCALITPAHAQDFDDDDARTMSARQDGQALRELAESEPPAGLSGDALNDFYVRQRRAALNLGDRELALAISRRHAAALPHRMGARWALWADLSQTDKLEESNALGQALVFHDPEFESHRPYRLRGLVFLALGYLAVGRADEADDLLGQAEQGLAEMVQHDASRRRRMLTTEQTLNRIHTTAMLHEARCGLLALRARSDDALQQCRLAVQVSDQGVDEARRVDPDRRMNAADQSVHERLQLAHLLAAQGRSYDAERMLKEAVERSRELGVQGSCRLSETDRLLALIRLDQRRDTEALRLATEAARIAAACDGGTLGGDTRNATRALLQVLVAQSRWPQALAVLDEADRLAHGRPFLRSRVLNPLPRALAYAYGGRAAAALPVITAYLESQRRTVGPQHTATALAQGVRGIVLAALGGAGAVEQARAELAAAARILVTPEAPGHELLQRGESATIGRLIFERYLGTLGAEPATAEVELAFGVADLMRGSSVQRALKEAAARNAASTAGLGEIVRRDQNASNELEVLYGVLSRHADDREEGRTEAAAAQTRARIAELEQVRAELRGRIAKGFPEYGHLVDPAPPSTLEVARQLGADEVLVALLPNGSRVHAWAVAGDGKLLYRATDLDSARLARLVQRLRSTLDVADLGAAAPAFDAAAAAELYDHLLRPLAPALDGKSHLVVAAGGVLAQIPFGVLLSGPAPPDAPPPWLIRQAALSQVPGAAAWLATRRLARTQGAAEPLAAWGDPLFDPGNTPAPGAVVRRLRIDRPRAAADDGSAPDPAARVLRYAQIPPLPETRDELLAIALTLHADPASDVLLGARATRGSVLAANRAGALTRKRVLAFATHGLMAGDLPGLDEPALALAASAGGGDGRDALLTLDDVLGLKLNADWVVLSACNTAAADGQGQEALSGLARGFFYAGTRALLVTHWAVETESASLLTTGTFRYYATHPEASKAESLRQATLAVMAMPKYAHPAYWAPYALAGDGGR